MSNGIFIIAHTPLANALRQSVLHVFPEASGVVMAFDVEPDAPLDVTLARAQMALAGLEASFVLVLTDLVGATPCNVAQKLVRAANAADAALLTGVNLPMLLRAITYQHETPKVLLACALAGGRQGVLQLLPTVPAS